MTTAATTGTSSATVLARAAVQSAKSDEEMIYCIAVTDEGECIRLSPLVSTKSNPLPSFKRWDRIRFNWKRSAKDKTLENLQLVPKSFEVLEPLSRSARAMALIPHEYASIDAAVKADKTIALLRPLRPIFFIRRKSPDELHQEVLSQKKLAGLTVPNISMVARDIAFGYNFSYRYSDAVGGQETPFLDWDVRESFINLSKSLGDALTISRMIQLWGKDYPQKGLIFVMSRPTITSTQWQITTALCLDEVEDMASRAINLMA